MGGIKEKVLAPKESGIKVVILPEQNRKDEDDFPKSLKEAISKGEIKLKYISEMKEVTEIALSGYPSKPVKKHNNATNY